jgi:hypothetical protein
MTRESLLVLASASLLFLGCSASSDTPGNDSAASSGGNAPSHAGAGMSSVGNQPSLGGNLNLGGSDASASGTGGMGPTCAADAAKANLTSAPIDIILVLDNSGSMVEEMGAAEQNINVNFAGILDTSGIDYRVILLSRHRQAERDASEEASTSICVSQPLSGLAACPAPKPVFSERFYQYGEKVESHDALDWVIEAFNTPDKKNKLAPMGYQPWLREAAKKVIVVMTDDDESTDTDETPITAQSFIQSLVTLSPAQFGADAAKPNIVFHSIVGVKEKAVATDPYLPTEPIEAAICTTNGADIVNAGQTYQELSRMTSGLRFPLCQFPGYDAVFRAIAKDVIVKAELTCDFAIPPTPAGKTLELDNIAVNHVKGDGSGDQQLQQIVDKATCKDGYFYIENERVWLCPESCESIKADLGGSISVLFTCESQIRDPK